MDILVKQCCLLQECYNVKFIVCVDDIAGCNIDMKKYHIMENGDVIDDNELLSMENKFYQASDNAQSESKSNSDEQYVKDPDIEINAFWLCGFVMTTYSFEWNMFVVLSVLLCCIDLTINAELYWNVFLVL